MTYVTISLVENQQENLPTHQALVANYPEFSFKFVSIYIAFVGSILIEIEPDLYVPRK